MSEPSTELQAERVADRLLARLAEQIRPWLVRELGQVLDPLDAASATEEAEIEAKAAAWISRRRTRPGKRQDQRHTRTARHA